LTDLPEPYVSADVDLKDFAFTPIYRARLFGSAFHSRASDSEWRAGVTLWLKSQDQTPAGSLPDNDVELCRLAELGPRRIRTWRRIRPAALRGWVKCSDGRLYHPEIAAQLAAAWAAKLKTRAKVIRRLEMETGAWADLRAAVYARDKFTCQYCGARDQRLECDHVIPLSRGGPSDLGNLVTACKPCNRSKGAKTLQEWRH